MDTPYRVLIADDHPLMRDALAKTVERALPGCELLLVGSFAETMMRLLAGHTPKQRIDLLLLDLRMPGMNGFAGLLAIRTEFPDIPVIIVSASDEPETIGRAVAYGAIGFVPKSAPEEMLRQAVRTVLAGGEFFPANTGPYAEDHAEAEFRRRLSSLTPQQLRVLLFIAEGKLNKQIAHEMAITLATVKAHITIIMRKLGVSSRTQAAIAMRRLNLETVKLPA